MKVFDSGMPEETYWNSLFDIPVILKWLNLRGVGDPVVEIGCGYGTFTIPIAREISGDVYAFDIEPVMADRTRGNAEKAELRNIHVSVRDAIAKGTGLEPDSAGFVLLFNILHFNDRRVLLQEAYRILKPNGIVAVIHWRKDIDTPRGPVVESRPDRKMILDSVEGLDLRFVGNERILEPYHWGIQLIKLE